MSGYTGDCTYGDAAFLVEEPQELLRPAWGKRRRRAIRMAPYGSRVIRQDLGPDLLELTLRICVENAEYAALEALVGESRTLTLLGGPAWSGVVLDELELIGVDDANGLTEARATFQRVG